MTDPVGLLVMRYAFPCAEIAKQQKRLTDAEYQDLENALLQGKGLPRNRLEPHFPALFRRLDEVAEKEELEAWSVDAVRTYFLEYHGAYIDKGDGLFSKMMPTAKELCRCRIGRVIKIEHRRGSPIYAIQIPPDTEERVLGQYLPGVEVGDIIVTHRRFATEKLSPDEAAKYGYQ